MANINISDLRPAGADLFLDSESYLKDLTEGEMINTLGGGSFSLWWCNSFFCFWEEQGRLAPMDIIKS